MPQQVANDIRASLRDLYAKKHTITTKRCIDGITQICYNKYNKKTEKKTMSRVFTKKPIVISLAFTVFIVAVITVFLGGMFNKYSPPSSENTSVINATVADAYYSLNKKAIVVETSDAGEFVLTYTTSRALHSETGYSSDELAEFIRGKDVELLVMNDLEWIVEIHAGDIIIDNTKLTARQVSITRASVIVLGIIALTLTVSAEILYLKKRLL